MTDYQIEHFHRNGFFFVPNPLDDDAIFEIDRRQRAVEPEWLQAEWAEGFNRGACQFFMVG